MRLARFILTLLLIAIFPVSIYSMAVVAFLGMVGPCVPDPNYPIPGIVYEASVWGSTLCILLLSVNILLGITLKYSNKPIHKLLWLALVAFLFAWGVPLLFPEPSYLEVARRVYNNEVTTWSLPMVIIQSASFMSLLACICWAMVKIKLRNLQLISASAQSSPAK
jgi:hypothetical protein